MTPHRNVALLLSIVSLFAAAQTAYAQARRITAPPKSTTPMKPAKPAGKDARLIAGTRRVTAPPPKSAEAQAAKRGKKGVAEPKPAPPLAKRTAVNANLSRRVTAASNQIAARRGQSPPPVAANQARLARTSNPTVLTSRLAQSGADERTRAKTPPAPAPVVAALRKGKFGKAEAAEGEGYEPVKQPPIRAPRVTSPPPTTRPDALAATARTDSLPTPTPLSDNAEPGESKVVLPDVIRVFEAGTDSPELERLLYLPLTRAMSPIGSTVGSNPAPPKIRKDIQIQPQRAVEIQQALAWFGYFSGDFTGVFDEQTVDAMWRFQRDHRIPATGYPTVLSLKKLGLN